MLAAIINRLLNHSPEASAALAQSAGRIICIKTPLLKETLVLTENGRLGETVALAEATLELPLTFFIVRAHDPAAAVRQLLLQGDVDLGGQVGRALGMLRWDAAEELSMIIGDALASRAMRFAGMLAEIPGALSGRLMATSVEYWRDEAAFLPKREQVEHWQAAVDMLRDDIARLEKRLERLE